MASDKFKENPKPMSRGEGEALEDTDTISKEAGNGINVKKQNPYGPPWPGLMQYFKGK